MRSTGKTKDKPGLNPKEERQILMECANGHFIRLGSLADSLEEQWHGIIRKYLPGEERDTVNDFIVQILEKKVGVFNPFYHETRCFLARRLRWHCLKVLDRRKREPKVFGLEDDLQLDPPSKAASPEKKAIINDLLNKFFYSLPKKFQDTFYQQEVVGIPPEEIAKNNDEARSTVSRRVMRAKEIFTKKMKALESRKKEFFKSP